MKNILARKIGMKQCILPDGRMTAMTILEVPKNTVLQVKTSEKDGHSAVVLGAFERKNFGKNENKKYTFIKEFSLEGESDLKKGGTVDVSSFEDVKNVKVVGISKGRGFAGVIKRHNFSRGRETHGSHHHREPGSVGMCAKPGRILRGKKMPGHYGDDQVTLRSVEIIDIDKQKNLIALQGPIPGANKSFVSLQQV